MNIAENIERVWRYGQYVPATRDPQFVKFLMESGLAEKWGAKESLAEGLGSTSLP